MNSPKSGRLNAQASTTCSPWVLMTVIVWPWATKAALPRRAGISMAAGIRSGFHGDQVDLDDAASCQRRHADRGAGRQFVTRKVGLIDRVQPGVVAREVGEEDAHADDVGEGQAAAFEDAQEVVHHLVGLRLDDALCLGCDSGFSRTSAGYVGESDGWQDF